MGEKNFREGGSGLFRVCCIDELVGCLGFWLVGWAEELRLLYTTKGYAIVECGISKKGLLDTYVYEGKVQVLLYICNCFMGSIRLQWVR